MIDWLNQLIHRLTKLSLHPSFIHYGGYLLLFPSQHDGLERRQSWFLEEVRITNQKTSKTFVFPCHAWLSLYDGDCQVKRILKPAAPGATERISLSYFHYFIQNLSFNNQDAIVGWILTSWLSLQAGSKMPLFCFI